MKSFLFGRKGKSKAKEESGKGFYKGFPDTGIPSSDTGIGASGELQLAKTGTTGENSCDNYQEGIDQSPSEHSSSAYESSYNQYLSKIENDHGVQSFEAMGPGATPASPEAYSGPGAGDPVMPQGAIAGVADPLSLSGGTSPSASSGANSNAHSISYVTQTPEHGYVEGCEDDLSTLGDESIIRRGRQNRQKQQELKERQLKHQEELLLKQKKSDLQDISKTRTASTQDMGTSPQSSGLSFSFTNVMDVHEKIPISSRLGDDIIEENRLHRDKDVLDLVIGEGGPGGDDDDTLLSKRRNESCCRRHKWTIIRVMIFLGFFMLISAAAVLVLSILQMKKNNAAIANSSDASYVDNDGNGGEFFNKPIFVPMDPSDSSLPDGIGDTFIVTLSPVLPIAPETAVPEPVTGKMDAEDADDDTTTPYAVTEPPIANNEEVPDENIFTGTDVPTEVIGDIINSIDSNNTNYYEVEAFDPDLTKIGTDLKFIIANKSPQSLSYLDDKASPQFKSFDWMSKDPDYWDMTIDTIVQRWTLGVLYYSTGGPNWKTDQLPVAFGLGKQPWLSYSDECEWESSNEGYQGKICDENNKYFAIHLRNIGLAGSLPPELGLLSDSMRLLFFNNNDLSGSLPSELGQLTGLEKINIQYNNIGGSLPSEIGNLEKLTIASMGNNQLTGSIPSELGMWASVATIGLENNQLNGTLPEELENMVNIEKLSIEKNLLSGKIPNSWNNMFQLTSLTLQSNDLSGNMPWGLCPGCYSMETLKVDCDEIKCKCCTECFGEPKKEKEHKNKERDAKEPVPAMDETATTTGLLPVSSNSSATTGGVRRA